MAEHLSGKPLKSKTLLKIDIPPGSKSLIIQMTSPNPNKVLYDAHTPVETYDMVIDSIYHSTYPEVDQEAMSSLLEDLRSTSPVFL